MGQLQRLKAEPLIEGFGAWVRVHYLEYHCRIAQGSGFFTNSFHQNTTDAEATRFGSNGNHLETQDLRGVYDLVLEELALEQDKTKPWQARLKTLAHNVRTLALRHPKLFPHLMISETVTEQEFEILEELYGLLDSAGLSPDSIAHASCALFTFITGFAMHESSGTLAQLSPSEEKALESLPPDRYPHMQRLKEAIKKSDPEADFEYGLELLIRGLEKPA